jgi:peptide/nickel transport system permease protein
VLDEINQDYVRTGRAKGLVRTGSCGCVPQRFDTVITRVMGAPGIAHRLLPDGAFSIPGIGREVILAVERSAFR